MKIAYLLCYYSADGNYEVRYKSNVLIYPNGEVLWVPPAIYQSSCTIDVTYFPFDQQTCIMKFGSWTFNGDQVSLALYNDKNFVDLSDYWKSGTWDIISVPAYLNTYQGDFPTETDITFYIIIRRCAFLFFDLYSIQLCKKNFVYTYSMFPISNTNWETVTSHFYNTK